MAGSEKIGISLSGGGYRATAFHLGTLKKLYELGVLEKTTVLSTISGGSITGACYCTERGSFDEFYDKLYDGLQENDVIRAALLSSLGLRLLLAAIVLLGSFGFFFTKYPWLFAVVFFTALFIIIRFQFVLFPISKRIEAVYNNFFFGQKKLSDLNERPILVVGSTNLQTSRPFIFSKLRMGDSAYQYRKKPILFDPYEFPIGRAVIASTCVPFAFTPVKMDEKFFKDKADAKVVHPMLVDGGVFDNQGIHKLMQKGEFDCPFVITSDAGGGSTGEITAGNTIKLLMETVNVFLNRIKNVQMVNDVYQNAKEANKQIAYLSLGWDVERCIPGFVDNLEKRQITKSVIDAHQLKPEWVDDPTKFRDQIEAYLANKTSYDKIAKPTTNEKRIARSVGTNLTALSKIQTDCLIKQAMALTEIQVKLYCPGII